MDSPEDDGASQGSVIGIATDVFFLYLFWSLLDAPEVASCLKSVPNFRMNLSVQQSTLMRVCALLPVIWFSSSDQVFVLRTSVFDRPCYGSEASVIREFSLRWRLLTIEAMWLPFS